MAEITGQYEGTRYADNVAIYDSSTGEIITSLAEVAEAVEGIGGAELPAEDVDDATDGTDVVTRFNELLASLRAAGVIA